MKCELNFTRRGWLSKDEFKVEGDVFRVTNDKKAKKNKENSLFKVHGNWNSKIFVTQYKQGKLDE